MTAAIPTVSALQVLPVLTAFDALGLPTARILTAAGLRRAELRENTRVSAESELELWRAAVELSQDPTLGLKVAELLRPGAMGSFEYLLRHSVTLEQLVLRAERFGRLVDDLSRVSLHREAGVASIVLGRTGGYPVPPAGAECLVAVALAAARLLWPRAQPRSVQFAHPLLGELAPYHRQFACPVSFGCGQSCIRFEERWLLEPALGVDSNLGNVLEQHTVHLLSQLPVSDDFASTVRQRMLELLERGELDNAALARSLHLSERTLRRRLQAEGIRYQGLLDELRRTLALRRVAQEELTLEALAASLGFADASTFYRTFKRWTGNTPAKYRAQLLVQRTLARKEP